MKKGVVLKIKRNSAIIMADNCMFYEVKGFNGMYKGMEICFSEKDIIKTATKIKERRYINAASFILFILCGYLFFSFYQDNYAAYAYVGIDMNPSIEISLNKKEQIIGVRGIDEEGKKIISELDINKMTGTEGVKKIIKKAIDENYLKPDSNNKITVYTIMEKNNDSMGNVIVNKIEDAIAEEVSINSIKGEIKTLVSDKNIKKRADNKGVSVVQYLLDDSESVMNEKKSTKDKQWKKDNIENKANPSQKEENKNNKNENNKDKNNKNIEKEQKKNNKNQNKNNKIEESKNENKDKYKEKIENEKNKGNNKNKYKDNAEKDGEKSKIKNKKDN